MDRSHLPLFFSLSSLLMSVAARMEVRTGADVEGNGEERPGAVEDAVRAFISLASFPSVPSDLSVLLRFRS